MNDIIPITEYLKVCRDAVYSFGEGFGQEFDKTTFLADSRTIEEFIKN